MKADRLLLIGATMMLLATVIPLPQVSAHVCAAVIPPAGPPCAVPCPQDGNYHRHSNVYPLTGQEEQCTSAPPPGATNPCPDQPTHTYGSGGSAGGRSATASGGNDFGVGVVTVTDTNADDCNGSGPGAWDGDYDSGVGGGAFGYGAWAQDPDCNYLLNVHGGNVAVNDVVFGGAIGFVVGEDDQSGPVKIQDPVDGSWTCTTSGSITPCPDNDPAQCGPTDDSDDCLSVHYTGTGATCGTGGGDGLYWVFLDGVFVSEGAEALGVGNPPTSGTITAF